MRYVLTGASGHIGNNLVRIINERFSEARVVVLTRRNIDIELEGTVCEQIVGDMTNADFFRENIKEGDRVIHLAALIDMSNTRQEEMYAVNYLMSKNICDAARLAGVDKFIYVSSVDTIYRTGKEAAIAEPADYYPEKIIDGYGNTKAMASKYVLDQMRAYPSFNASIILPTAVLGIHDYKPSEIGKVIRSSLEGKAQVGIKGGYNFVNVKDVCSAILSMCEHTKQEQYIISGENVSVKELFEKINDYKSINRKPIILPTFVAIMACPFVKMLSRLMIKALQDPHNYSSEKARSELGYKATPFQKTLQETIDWHGENLPVK